MLQRHRGLPLLHLTLGRQWLIVAGEDLAEEGREDEGGKEEEERTYTRFSSKTCPQPEFHQHKRLDRCHRSIDTLLPQVS